MATEGKFVANKKCKKCKKRKVYLEDAGDRFIYTCKACGETWEV